MEKRQDILKELQAISPLIADIQPVNTFAVPAGYFDQLPAVILEKIGIETLLTDASRPTYRLPAGYFEGLAGTVLSRIKSQSNEIQAELAAIAPLLNTIGKHEIYTVPAGYFEQADFAAAAQNAKTDARVITMRRASRWMQYVAAAMMAGVLVTGAFLFTDNRTNFDEQNERLDISSELNKVSADELVTYLNNPEHAIAAPATTLSASEAEMVDVQKNIRLLSDEELNQFLKENAGPFDSLAAEKE